MNNTILVYQINPNGTPGISKYIDPKEGVDNGWTYNIPPTDSFCRWENGDWMVLEHAVVTPLPHIIPKNHKLEEINVRKHRDNLIAQTDWTQVKDISDETSSKWTSYRQELRDISKQSGFPFNINWPKSP